MFRLSALSTHTCLLKLLLFPGPSSLLVSETAAATLRFRKVFGRQFNSNMQLLMSKPSSVTSLIEERDATNPIKPTDISHPLGSSNPFTRDTSNALGDECAKDPLKLGVIAKIDARFYFGDQGLKLGDDSDSKDSE